MTGKVGIFGCGVQKAGTTTLFGYLAAHPQLQPPSRKEIHYFDNDGLDWARPDHAVLHGFFPPADAELKRFEVTPIYAFWPPSIPRLLAYNPAAKVLLLFRDPLDRAFSNWRMETRRGSETLPFAEAIRLEDEQLAGLPELAVERRHRSYVGRGRYFDQLSRVLAHFPAQQVLCLRLEDLSHNHVETLARVADFLEISPFPDLPPLREHVAADDGAPPPTRDDLRFVRMALGDDLRAFAGLSGLDVSHWPTAG